MLFLQILVIAASIGLLFYAFSLAVEGMRVGRRIRRFSMNVRGLKTMYGETVIADFRGLSEDIESLKRKTNDIAGAFLLPKPRTKEKLEIDLPPSLSEILEGPLKELADTVSLLKRMYSFLAEIVFPRGKE